MFGGGTSRVRANTHRYGTVGIGREHRPPELSFPGDLSNTHLSILEVFDSKLPKKIDQKPRLSGGEGIRGR